ncbi:MAG: hypothetical protein ACREOU_03310 [Candidatus Eiseniibacteriota bacterium]
MNRVLVLTALLVVALASHVGAAVPQTMSYQGVLTDNSGNLVPDGAYDLTFRIFDVSVAGAALYAETHPAVLVTKGGFSVVIGEITPINLPFDVQYWLEVQVNLDAPLVPRVKFASSPYGLSLRLPFVGSTDVATPGAGIEITNTGTGRALSGTSNSTLAGAAAILGIISSTGPGSNSAAVRGQNSGTGGNGVGVYGSHAGSGLGVFGTSISGDGVRGITNSGFGVQAAALTTGTGLVSQAQTGTAIFATSDDGIGVNALSSTFKAIYGQTNSTAGGAYAIHGVVNPTNPGTASAALRGENNGTGPFGIGVYGTQDGTGYGVQGTAPGGRGVFGSSTTGQGVYASSASGDAVFATTATGRAVYAQNASTANNAYAIHGVILSTAPGGASAGVRGQNNGTGVVGIGVWGSHAGSGWGVYGSAPLAGYAGNFSGRVNVTGTLTKGAGAFKIDHPLDPENQYLYHSFVESPDMKNIYDGVVVLDEYGEATITMPEWFEALNQDFRYQLTAIGEPAPNLHVAQKLEACRFQIAGGVSGMEVSWQLTGIRHDAAANAHRIPLEVAKADEERGLYLDPVAFGQPEEKGIGYQEQRRLSGEERTVAATTDVPARGRR